MPGCPAVKPKRELIEVVVQMFMAHSALMRAQEPPFEQSSCPVTERQQIVTHLSFFMHYFMNVAQTVQAIVPLPSIGTNLASWLHGLLNSLLQAFRRSIRDLSKPNPSDSRAIQLSCNHDQRLPCRSTPPFPSLLPPMYDSSTSTMPKSRSRPGRTIARRSLCNHIHGVR